MGQVTVSIAERTYRIACDDGQEDHLVALAQDLDDRIGEMRKAFGEIGDSRLTVMAAIAVLDERSELKRRLAALEEQVAQLRDDRLATEAHTATELNALASAITDAADRIETVARTLNPDRAG
jgi:cell division protein ZapA